MRPPGRDRAEGESGFSLVEVMAASVILILIVVSFSYLIVNSLETALLSKQRETAASIADGTIENARSLGIAGLAATTGQTCEEPFTDTGAYAANPYTFVPILTSSTFGQCEQVTVDHTTYEVSASSQVCTASDQSCANSTTAYLVQADVYWQAHEYTTASVVGQ